MTIVTIERRISACLGACNGISTEVLEAGAIEHLQRAATVALEMLQDLHRQTESQREYAEMGAGIIRLQVALAKLDGTFGQ